MSDGDLNWIANYIWGIADDVQRGAGRRYLSNLSGGSAHGGSPHQRMPAPGGRVWHTRGRVCYNGPRRPRAAPEFLSQRPFRPHVTHEKEDGCLSWSIPMAGVP